MNPRLIIILIILLVISQSAY
ncbi:type I toxin-antitoxin system Ibs family toxin [Histophilus somni]|nr:type I toxin-antitoxin system Ibs family toxin [Histophilus somni]QQJ91027.1 type I toxin-antitoxin system Ibs family toxin [Histophilus somni]